MIPRVVIDTNVVVSAAITRRGTPAAALDLVAAHRVTLCVSQPILVEYEGVLLRPKLRLDPERVRWLLDLARLEGVFITPTRTLKESPDEADNRFLECAAAAGAGYLVTGNIKDFPQKFETTKILTPRQFVAQMQMEKK
jgi:putative PIN family toxin of toxin-antitoxin system